MLKWVIGSVLVILSAVGCGKAPLTPAAPVAPATAMEAQPCTLTCVTTDPAGKNVAYRFDWDEGDTSGWTGFLASGVTCTVIHVWDRNGVYAVRAQAKNDAERLSGWSEPDTVKVDSLCRLK